MSTYQLGIDIGGTFTDAVFTDDGGRRWVFKVPTTPADPGVGFVDAVDAAREVAPLTTDNLVHLVHATTVATNAIIEGKTARVGLVVTEGFRDLLEIGRQIRPDLFDLLRQKPKPLVPRDLVIEVRERLGPTGEVLTPVDTQSVARAADLLREAKVSGVVVCLLHSYVEPRHERAVGSQLRELLPGLEVSLSSEVWPEFREYFRASTCIVNMAIQPVVRAYLESVQARLRERALSSDFYVMQSSGGGMTAEAAKDLPVQLIESGPAAGLIATSELARRMDWPRVVSLDIGGTTAKVGLVLDGRPTLSYEYEVGAMAAPGGGRSKASGYPIRTPVLDLVEIGAGGGSMAWIDSGGALRVGPASAGADPGPACYARGGTVPTVTDANLVLGRIDPQSFLGGAMKLDLDAAHLAIEQHCAAPLGLSVVEAAAGIIDVANASMARALRLITVQRGHDPRDFVLVAYGGAGPLHANALAADLGFSRVVIPPDPGVLSAAGLLLADVTHIESNTHLVPCDTVTHPDLVERLRTLADRVLRRLADQGKSAEQVALSYSLDMRFHGQSYELNIAVPNLDDPHAVAAARDAFISAHEQAYGHAARDEEIELVNWKVSGVAPGFRHAQAATIDGQMVDGPVAPVRSREVSDRHGTAVISTFDRLSLTPSVVVWGPAVISEMGATSFVHDGYHASQDSRGGNLYIEKD